MTMTVNPLASIRELYGSPARPRPPAPPRPPSSEAAHALRMANSLTNGLISYSLGVPRTAPAPANLRADAVTGIVWAPSIFGVLLPFFGVAQINASIALTSMIGKATSVHSGSAESDGGIGWLVVELNQQGTFNGLSLSTWTDQSTTSPSAADRHKTRRSRTLLSLSRPPSSPGRSASTRSTSDCSATS